jgi:hypothetical protein
MGGVGSGSWHRWNTKETTESQYCIDIRWLKKRNYLKDGISGTLSWFRGSEATGSISYKIKKQQMILSYHCQTSGHDCESIEQVVYFDYTYCNYGGQRMWFLCPTCGKRVAILYCIRTHFLCRHCCNLTYASQQENYTDRSFRYASNIRKKLGGGSDPLDPFPWKPKYMHWRTYWKLRKKAKEAEQTGWDSLLKKSLNYQRVGSE